VMAPCLAPRNLAAFANVRVRESSIDHVRPGSVAFA
jgi:hypothetical protein